MPADSCAIGEVDAAISSSSSGGGGGGITAALDTATTGRRISARLPGE